MLQKSASRVTTPTRVALPFENGDHMDQPTFHELYKQTPEEFRAELIQGIVYFTPPTPFTKGYLRGQLAYFAMSYVESTPGLDAVIGVTTFLSDDSEVEPHCSLFIKPQHRGQSRLNDEDFIVGSPEMVLEVANRPASIQLHSKRLAYEAAQVREYVVLIASENQVRWYVRNRESQFTLMKPKNGVYRSKVYPGLWLHESAIFEHHSPLFMDTLRAGLATPEHAAFVANLAKQATKRTES